MAAQEARVEIARGRSRATGSGEVPQAMVHVIDGDVVAVLQVRRSRLGAAPKHVHPFVIQRRTVATAREVRV
jgi:hypothetical protein